jgi:tRNA1(Val) A37 N6-methylase TrmN6
MNETTTDSLLGGRVTYVQPARGYRVAVEAPLIAAFALSPLTRAVEHAVDLGAGPGAVGLMLLAAGGCARATAVEIDALHASLARRNALENKLDLRVVEADVAEAQTEPAALVVANPPWFEPDRGDVSEDPTKAGARAFTRGTLDAFVEAARRIVIPRGRVSLSMPSSRTTELLAVLAAHGLHAKRLRFVHPRPQREANVVFVEARRAKPGGLVVERPLFVRGREGEEYTTEVAEILRGRALRTASAAAERAAGERSSEPAEESDPE